MKGRLEAAVHTRPLRPSALPPLCCPALLHPSGSRRISPLCSAAQLSSQAALPTPCSLSFQPWPLIQVVCDVSGRLESATRENIISLMRRGRYDTHARSRSHTCTHVGHSLNTRAHTRRRGRNLAIIPGGFEDATLYARGKHRTAMSNRKGLVK